MPDESITAIRKYLKNKLLKNKELLGHQKERVEVFDLLQRTVEQGESNSVLLIGPSGVGKTTLINSVLEDLHGYHEDCIIVKLHGLLHTDDRLAMKSITFQMDLDNAVDGKVFGSFAENLAFLLACVRTGEKHQSKSVIFILEDFDLFCTHHNQTLLYNLFDISQSTQAPICVVGLTCRIDVIQLLEKRVKSRFSHRQIFLYPGSTDKSELEFVLARVKWYLELPDKTKVPNSAKKQWNMHIEALIKDKKCHNILQRLIDVDCNENTLKNILVRCVFSLSESNRTLTVQQFEKELNILEKDDMTQVLLDLSVLELCLIVAMKHHCDIYDNNPMNFEMVYTRYVKFASKHSGMQNVQRPVVMKAFEHIQKLELVEIIHQGNTKLQKEYQFFRLLVTSQQLSEAIGKFPGLPTEIVQWSNRAI